MALAAFAMRAALHFSKKQAGQSLRRVLVCTSIAAVSVLLHFGSVIGQVSRAYEFPELSMVLLLVVGVVAATVLSEGWSWACMATLGVARALAESVLPSVATLGFLTMISSKDITNESGSPEDDVPGELDDQADGSDGTNLFAPHLEAIAVLHLALFALRGSLGQRALTGRRGALIRAVVDLCLLAILRWRLEPEALVFSSGDFRRILAVVLRASVVAAWLSLSEVANFCVCAFQTFGGGDWADVQKHGLVVTTQLYNVAMETPSSAFCWTIAAARIGAPLCVALYAMSALDPLSNHEHMWVFVAFAGIASLSAGAEIFRALKYLVTSQHVLYPDFLHRAAFLSGVDELRMMAEIAAQAGCALAAVPGKILDFLANLPRIKVRRKNGGSKGPGDTSDDDGDGGDGDGDGDDSGDDDMPPMSEQEKVCIENFKSAIGPLDVVIAFFGNVSAGKSSLIRALLGPDHELFDGFSAGLAPGWTREPHAAVWFVLPDGRKVWLVDVPGFGTTVRGAAQGKRPGTSEKQSQNEIDADDAAMDQLAIEQIERVVEAIEKKALASVFVIKDAQSDEYVEKNCNRVKGRFAHHIVAFNGFMSSSAVRQTKKEDREAAFLKFRKPFVAGSPASDSVHVNVPGYAYNSDPKFRNEARVDELDEKLRKLAEDEDLRRLAEEREQERKFEEASPIRALFEGMFGGVKSAAGAQAVEHATRKAFQEGVRESLRSAGKESTLKAAKEVGLKGGVKSLTRHAAMKGGRAAASSAGGLKNCLQINASAGAIFEAPFFIYKTANIVLEHATVEEKTQAVAEVAVDSGVNVGVGAAGAAIGQVVCPIPVLGAVLGGVVAGACYSGFKSAMGTSPGRIKPRA